jgi:septum formation protein
MTTESQHLLLASASPRRRQILAQLGLPYDVSVSPGDEDAAQDQYKGSSDGLALWTATYKALMMFSLPTTGDSVVITADTTVLLDDHVLGKPHDQDRAREQLIALRGRWHQVVTGVVVSRRIDGQLQMKGATCSTPVLMRNYSEEEIAAYIATGDPMDKAGAYGIQHTQFQPTELIDGCYYNVVGLPLCKLVPLLADFDIHPQATGCANTACPWSDLCRVDRHANEHI